MPGSTGGEGAGRPSYSAFLRTNLIDLLWWYLMAAHHAVTYSSLMTMEMVGGYGASARRFLSCRGAAGGSVLSGLAMLVSATRLERWVVWCIREVAPPPVCGPERGLGAPGRT